MLDLVSVQKENMEMRRQCSRYSTCVERGSENLIQGIYDVSTSELSNTLQVLVHDSGLGATLRDVQDPRRAAC